MSIEDEFRTEVFTADDGDPGLRWLTDEQVIERMSDTILALRSEVERQAGIIAALDRTVEELSGENVALRAALAPFAAEWDPSDTQYRDETPWGLGPDFTVGDVRRAAALLNEEEG